VALPKPIKPKNFNHWTPAQIVMLKQHYETGSQKFLEELLYPHPMSSIWVKARKLNLYRPDGRDARYKPRPGLHPIIGELRKIRKRKGIKQSTMAQDLQCSTASFARNENGRMGLPGLNKVAAWAWVLSYLVMKLF